MGVSFVTGLTRGRMWWTLGLRVPKLPLKSHSCPSSHMQFFTAWDASGPSLESAWMGRGGVCWERLLVCLWLCSLSNGDCQASSASPLYLHPCHWDQPQCVFVNQKLNAQISRLQTPCSIVWYLLLQFPLWPAASSGRLLRRDEVWEGWTRPTVSVTTF